MTLFDPDPYGGPPRAKRKRRPKVHPDDAERVDVDRRWRMVATVRGVYANAHLGTFITGERGEPLVSTFCGLLGRPLTLDGTRPTACPTCRAKRDDALREGRG